MRIMKTNKKTQTVPNSEHEEWLAEHKRRTEFKPEFKSEKGDTSGNYRVYEEIIKLYPHMEHILKALYTLPMYTIHLINEDYEQITFFFYQSMGLYPELADDIKAYRIFIQFPGNTAYNYSVSINKVKAK